ncbi:MAG TPA: N-acetyl-alpha-D-glucosaminyl L-malate synthase BshA [Terriglobales bacterium]|jgi:N-acetyl-alpha-D-glucosaminyl L-malate synthase BshA|nr:N-acetyl-alpha-D-glucosaminyl L-malate synthase BshA [Terriglobales bacterium]
MYMRESLKIGITGYPTYGGSGVVATELGLELAQRGHEIHFISYAQPIRLDRPTPNIHYHEVEVSRYPLFDYPPYDLALATRMAEVSELYDLDLLHVHYAIPHSVSALLARQMLAAGPKKRKLPFVTTLHGTDITLVGQDRSYLPITRYSIEESDGVTAISQYLRERTVREFEVKNHIEVIYNFVNCDVYCRDQNFSERRKQYATGGERILIHISNFRPVKRVTDVIEVFDRVRKQIPSKLLLLGDGPDRSPAEWLAVQKGIHNDVIFLGKREQVYETLAISDVLVMPSELESFGLAALEAMASEVVPIATKVGGVPELIEHGKSGFLAEVGDVESMAGFAIDILKDEDRLRAMGKQCREAARARFCTTKIIPQYEAFYRRVLERSS